MAGRPEDRREERSINDQPSKRDTKGKRKKERRKRKRKIARSQWILSGTASQHGTEKGDQVYNGLGINDYHLDNLEMVLGPNEIMVLGGGGFDGVH